MDKLTDEEKKVVEELKRKTINDVTPKMLEDSSLFYRFAKARDFNLMEAEDMLKKHLAWRKEFEIDTILTDYKPPLVLMKYGASNFLCFDKEGSAVRLQDWGRGDTRTLTSLVTKADTAKYWFFLAEEDKECISKKGGNFTKPHFILIYDLEELTYANAVHVKTLQYLVYGIKLLIDNYPESVKAVNVINAPFYFSWTYAVIKTILPVSVTQKMRIFGTDGWKEALLKEIDADDLPAYLGGNRTDPDGNPFCDTTINHGRRIPKSYLQKNGSKKRLSQLSDVEKVTVKPFSQEEITFEIKEEDSYLEWEIEVKNKDIDFSLRYDGGATEDLESEEIVPKQRIDSSCEIEKGCFKCEKVGKYSIVFDNTFSWLHSKEVYYKVQIRSMKNNEMYKST